MCKHRPETRLTANSKHRLELDPEVVSLARSRGILSRLPPHLAAELLDGAQRAQFPRGAHVLSWPNPTSSVVVLRGALRVYLADGEGRQVTTRYVRPGDIFGFVMESPIVCHLQALEDSELLMVDPERIYSLARTNPLFAGELLDEMKAAMASALRAIYVRAFGTVRERVVNAILDHASLTGSVEPGRNVLGTQQELALAVGSVREVVAGVLHQLKRDGFIDVRRGSVVILQPEKLAREAAGGPWAEDRPGRTAARGE